jgi:hypothetical protein
VRLTDIEVLDAPFRFLVRSGRDPNLSYIVDLNHEGRAVCSCDRNMLGGRVCRHIKAIRRLIKCYQRRACAGS